MADISTRMSVEGLSQYKSAFSQAQNAVKTLDAQLKQSEAQFKATGNQEQYLADKGKILQQQLKLQKQAAEQAKAALKQMDAQGVNPMSRSYQEFAQKLANAETAIINTTSALNTLGQSEDSAAAGADKLTTSVNGINKKISLDQVIGGIDRITGGLESAAKKAIEFGKQLWNTIMDSASQADDISTMATRLGLTDKEVQQMMYVADAFEAPVETMAKTWKKLKNNMASDNAEIVKDFEKIGVATHKVLSGKYGEVIGPARDYKDVFWEVGEALMAMTDASEQERIAQKLLGRSWDEMIPLFTKGREAYEEAVKAAPTASEDAVESAAALNDRVKELEKSWNTLKLEVIGAVAPALEKGADALANVLDKLTEYLQTDEGQELLKGLGDAVSDLFGDLENINAEELSNNVASVINGLTDGLKWLGNNWGTVKDALGRIVDGWALLKLTGGAAEVLKLVNGVKDLAGGGAAAAGGAAGASWGSAFAAAVLKAAPWITFLYETLKPGETVDNSLADANGNLTPEGWSDFYDQRRRASNGQTQDNVWYDLIMEAGEIVNGAAALWDDFDGINALARYANSRDRGKLADDLAALGYTLRLTDDELMADIPSGGSTNVESTGGLIHKDRRTGEPIVEVDPVVPEDASGLISQQIGPVPVSITIRDVSGAELESLVGGGSNANGLPWVPYDGYLSVLHRGERVMTASENRQYTYNNNTYFGNVNLNNGLEVDALTESIARNNRRKNSGYGA